VIEFVVFTLSSSCVGIRTVKSFVKIRNLKLFYFVCFHSLWSGLCGNSIYAVELCTVLNKILRILVGAKSKLFCREILGSLTSFCFPLNTYCQDFVMENVEKF